MGATLPNFTAPDQYTDASTLQCPGTVRIRLQIYNQAIFWQRGISPAGGGGVRWEEEEFVPPGPLSLNERCEAIRVRAAVPAAQVEGNGRRPAQVTISTRTAAELRE